MNIFLPFKQDKNPVLDEIQQHFDGDFIYDHFKKYDSYDIDIVNIHWPESIFNFSEPSNQDLEELEDELKKWKTKSKVVFTRHNSLPHKSKSTNFIALYNLVIKYADGIIHLGEYSLNEFATSLPQHSHLKATIIYHPAYTIFENSVSKSDARKKLNIPLHKKVILVFGSLRTEKELDLVLNSFDALKIKNKHLIISYLNIYKPLPKTAKQRITKFINTKIERIKLQLKSDLTVNYTFIENNDVQNYLNAADVLFLPRINLLNSGNLFLGLSFKKVVVGPEIGNITEVLKATQNPFFDPKDIESATLALEKGLAISDNKGNENYNFVNNHCQPIDIAKSYYKFFSEIINQP